MRERQKTFAGAGRFDLYFTDKFGTNVLMELKAVPARYEHASQLARYRDALRAAGENRVLMWLVAPVIPASVREFLAHIGIEYSEIHEAEFLRVAGRHGHVLYREAQALSSVSATTSTRTIPSPHILKTTQSRPWHFNTDEKEIRGATDHMLRLSCFALWGYPQTEQKMNRPAAGDPIIFYKSRVGIIGTAFVGSEHAVSTGKIFDKQAEHEYCRTVLDLEYVADEHALNAQRLRDLGISHIPIQGLCRAYSPESFTLIRSQLVTRRVSRSHA